MWRRRASVICDCERGAGARSILRSNAEEGGHSKPWRNQKRPRLSRKRPGVRRLYGAFSESGWYFRCGRVKSGAGGVEGLTSVLELRAARRRRTPKPDTEVPTPLSSCQRVAENSYALGERASVLECAGSAALSSRSKNTPSSPIHSESPSDPAPPPLVSWKTERNR